MRCRPGSRRAAQQVPRKVRQSLELHALEEHDGHEPATCPPPSWIGDGSMWRPTLLSVVIGSAAAYNEKKRRAGMRAEALMQCLQN